MQCASPNCVKSCIRYTIEIINYPILWVSGIQMTVATTYTEYEHTAVLLALQLGIPLLAVIYSATIKNSILRNIRAQCLN